MALPLIVVNDLFGDGLTVADFNGDGILDMVVSEIDPVPPGTGACNLGLDNCWLQVFLGNGDGTFTALPNRIPSIDIVANIVTADFNGDGNADLADTSSSTYVQVLLGNGDGTFTAAPNIAIPGPYGIVAADLNGDGNADLAVNNQGTTFVLLGKGNGTFTQLPDSPALDLQAASLAVGDFNGDGIPDLVVPDVNGGYTNVFIGKGDGTFTGDAFSPSVAGYIFDNLAVADFNGDGQSDFAAGIDDDNTYDNPPMDQLSVFLSQSPSTSAAYVYNISPVGTGLHYVDASYPGDSNNVPGISVTIPLDAQQVTTTLMLTASPSPSYPGQTVTLTATLSPFLAQDHYASGNVTFTSNGKLVGTAAVTNGVATLTTSALALGTDKLEAKYPGDTNFTSSVTSVVPIVISGTTGLTLTSSLNPAPALTSITFTAHLAVGSQPAPIGSAISLSLNTQFIVLTTDANGNASYTTSALTAGSYPVTAAFAATANLLGSSAMLTQVMTAPLSSFTIALSPNTVTMVGGQSKTVAIQLTSVGNFAGPLALTYGPLPTYATASIAPTPVTLTAGGTGSSTLTLHTLQVVRNEAPGVGGSHPSRTERAMDGAPRRRWPAVGLASVLLMLALGRRRRMGRVLCMLLVAVAMQTLSGCNTAYYRDEVVSPGSYVVTVTATDGSGNSQSATLTVAITP